MKITMYVTNTCPFCTYAKNLLKNKGVDISKITIINLSENPELSKKMTELTGKQTVPQIFVDNTHIGGYGDLKDLDEKGKLDKILKKN